MKKESKSPRIEFVVWFGQL